MNYAINNATFTALPWMVGFNRQLETLTRMQETMGRGSTYPPYNIIRHTDDEFTVEMALAGFTKDEISIEVKDSVMTVKGSKEGKRDDEFLHRGIGTRDFTSQFVLGEYVEVDTASMTDGILAIELERRIPEEHKPKLIEIL